MAGGAALGGLAGGLLLLFFGGSRLAESKGFQRIALTDTHESAKGYTVNPLPNMVGKTGIAQTVLRPGGKIMIDQEVYDAFSRGDYIEKGERVEVISMEGVTLRVRKA